MKQLLLVSWLLSLSAILGLPEVKADVRMPLIFGNHMVLQQDTRITIWGWADAGENIEVLFAGQKSENHCQCRWDMAGKTEAGKNEEKKERR